MKKVLTLLLGSCLLSFSLANAQNAGEEAKIRGLITEMVDLIDGMHEINDAKHLFSLYAPNYSAVRTDYLPDGSHSTHPRTLDDLQSRVSRFANDLNQDVDYKLLEIPFIKVLGNTAVANYITEFQSYNQGARLIGGTRNVIARLVKVNGDWKIQHAQITEIRENVDRALCNYEVFGKNENNYALKVHYPAGSTFREEFINVKFEPMTAGGFMVYSDKGKVRWESNQLQFGEGTGNTTRVPASNRDAAMSEIVKYYYPQQCAAVEKIK